MQNAKDLTPAQIQAILDENAKLQTRNNELEEKAKKQSTVSCKVSEKGAVSVYGFGRFPVTLYKSQWDKLFDNGEMIKKFIKDNESKLSVKD